MFNDQITDSDSFLDMPISTQALYFHLISAADNDGFVNKWRSIIKKIGASNIDFTLLVEKKFLYYFESGVIVIKHWRIHNLLRYDRYKPTVYQDELAMLDLRDNKAYTMKLIEIEEAETLFDYDDGKPNGNQWLTQDKISKDKISKVKISKDIEESPKTEIIDNRKKSKGRKKFMPPTLQEVTDYCKVRKNNVDPKKFFDYFEAGNWIDSNNNPVKNWKQKVITWENMNQNKGVSDNAKTETSTKKYVRREDR